MPPVNRIEQQSSCNTDRARQYIRSKPDETMLLALAAGAVVGVAIGVAIGGSPTRSSYSRRTAERLGDRLMASLDRVLPDSISHTLGVK